MGGEGEKGCSAPLKAAAEGISTVKAPANCSFPLKLLMLYFDNKVQHRELHMLKHTHTITHRSMTGR